MFIGSLSQRCSQLLLIYIRVDADTNNSSHFIVKEFVWSWLSRLVFTCRTLITPGYLPNDGGSRESCNQ